MMRAFIFPVLLAVAVFSPAIGDEWVSQCLIFGTTVTLECPIESDISWYSYLDYDYDLDDYGIATFDTSTLSCSHGLCGVEEISCFTNHNFSHVVMVVADVATPVLPIKPSLPLGEGGDIITLSWDNIHVPDFDEPAYYNYTVTVNITDGYYITHNISVDVTQPNVSLAVNVTGLKCKPFEIDISMPGNCKPSILRGFLPIVPEFVQENVSAKTSFNYEGLWDIVAISFTPPILCYINQVYYTLCFDDDEGESWCTDLVPLVDSAKVELYLSNADDQRLKREKNYTVRVTIVTEYGNVSSTTDFSTESPRSSPGVFYDLRMVNFTRTFVYLTWKNPTYPNPAFPYTIIIKHYKTGEIMELDKTSRRTEGDPVIAIDLKGNECEIVEVSVAVTGYEEEKQMVNISLPAYNTSFSSPLYIETSLYDDGTVREVELTFKPPRICSFQSASYVLVITKTDGAQTHYRGPVMIKDSLEPVKVELETGFTVNTRYTATVTVLTPFGNSSSSQTFSFIVESPPSKSGLNEPTEDLPSSAVVGGAVGGVLGLLLVVLVLGFVGGIAMVYYLRQRKAKKRRARVTSMAKNMVPNPIYDDGSGELYEELPDDPPLQLSMNFNGASATPLPPSIPPPRKTEELSASERAAIEAKLSSSAPGGGDRLSLSSSQYGEDAEDCYTVMSPAGTMTVLPRNNRHSSASVGANWPAPHDNI